MSLNPEAAAGWFGLALPFTPIISISREGAGVPKWAARPLQQHLSPQCGEGTPQATGFFEVMVAGKLVHSKKVMVSVHPSRLVLRLAGCWDLTPSLFFPSPER